MKKNKKSTHRPQTRPRLKCQPKVIQDSNPDFWINPDSDISGSLRKGGLTA